MSWWCITMIENLFLCVGAQKSGTTWLHKQLEDHPDIGFGELGSMRLKEVHYFNTIHNGSLLLIRRNVNRLKRVINNNQLILERYFLNKSTGKNSDKNIEKLLSPINDDWYMDLFNNNEKKYAADFSPEYALLPKEGFENIKKVSRNQKIIFLMRDPVSRSISAIQYFFQKKGIAPENITPDMLLEVSNKGFIVDFSRYEKTIALLRESFAEDQLKFIFFEDIMSDKQNSINEICSFLEIQNVGYSHENAETKVNASKKIIFPDQVEGVLEEKLSKTYAYMYAHFDNVPARWKNV